MSGQKSSERTAQPELPLTIRQVVSSMDTSGLEERRDLNPPTVPLKAMGLQVGFHQCSEKVIF